MSVNLISKAKIAFPELSQPLDRLSPYRLDSDASFENKIKYYFFLVWNAVKAIFGNSEWQIAKKEIHEWAFNKVKAVLPELNPNVKILNEADTEILVDAGMSVITEGELNKSKIFETLKSHVATTMEKEFSTSKKFGEYFFNLVCGTYVGTEPSQADHLNFSAELLQFQNKVTEKTAESLEKDMFTDNKILPKVDQYVKDFFVELYKKGQISAHSVVALDKVVDLSIRYFKENKVLHLMAQEVIVKAILLDNDQRAIPVVAQ